MNTTVGPLAHAIAQNTSSHEAAAAALTLVCVVVLACLVAAYAHVMVDRWKRSRGIPGLAVISVMVAVIAFVMVLMAFFVVLG